MPTNLAFMSMHWAEQFALSGGVNHVINEQVDPVSQQPGFKCQPVTLSPVVPALQGLVFGEHDSTAKGLTWQVAQTLTSGICYHLAFEDQQDGFAYQASPHAIQWTLIVNKQLLHIQCHVEKGLLKALKILSSMPVDIALEPMNAYIGKALNSQLLKQLHQQIKAGNSPLLCTCTGVTEAMLDEQINHHLNQQLFKGSVASLNFEQALDNTQINLGCGRQCGSCQSEVTQCATTAWEQALDLVAIEQSTQEEVA
jgi:assimilatory nitrate reductase catalytic subunit